MRIEKCLPEEAEETAPQLPPLPSEQPPPKPAILRQGVDVKDAETTTPPVPFTEWIGNADSYAEPGEP